MTGDGNHSVFVGWFGLLLYSCAYLAFKHLRWTSQIIHIAYII